MSEQAPERPRSQGNVLSQKVGPLPVWGWLGLMAAAGIGYIWWRNKQNAAASTSSGTGSETSSTSGQQDYAPQYAAIQSEVQNLQTGAAQSSAAETSTENKQEAQIKGAQGQIKSLGSDVRTLRGEQKKDVTKKPPAKKTTAKAPAKKAPVKKAPLKRAPVKKTNDLAKKG